MHVAWFIAIWAIILPLSLLAQPQPPSFSSSDGGASSFPPFGGGSDGGTGGVLSGALPAYPNAQHADQFFASFPQFGGHRGGGRGGGGGGGFPSFGGDGGGGGRGFQLPSFGGASSSGSGGGASAAAALPAALSANQLAQATQTMSSLMSGPSFMPQMASFTEMAKQVMVDQAHGAGPAAPFGAAAGGAPFGSGATSPPGGTGSPFGGGSSDDLNVSPQDLVAPSAEPQECAPPDFQCQMLKACYGCYSDLTKPYCVSCLLLKHCQNGDMPCQSQKSCTVCKQIKGQSGVYQPKLCSLIKC